MDAFTIIRTLALRLALLLGIVLAVTFVINLSWFDEALHPELERLIPPGSVSMQHNAYPLIYGFSAASDRDFREAGLSIVAALQERFANGERVTLSAEQIDEILARPDDRGTWGTVLPALDCNTRFELDCADRLNAEVAGQRRLDPRLQLLLSRYESILETPGFAENQEFDAYTPLPDYRLLMEVSRIRLAVSYLSDSIAQSIEKTRQDVEFWKTMLRDGQSLVAKMVALAGLRNDTAFLSALMRGKSVDAQELAGIAAMAEPLSDAERDIGETFLAEIRILMLSSKSLGVLLEGPSWINELALQERATMNEFYLNNTVPLRLRASMSAPEFYLQRAYEPLSYDVRAFPPPLYNLGGKMVLKWVASEMSLQDYISRVHDLDGRLALLALQAEIAMHPEHSVADTVRASAHRNPYTREPMDYDQAAATIGFDCLGNGSDNCALLLRKR